MNLYQIMMINEDVTLLHITKKAVLLIEKEIRSNTYQL